MSKKKTREEFIQDAREKHGDKYDYSKVEYMNNHTKVCIICPEHGEFWQKPNSHLNGSGCPKCGSNAIGNSLRLSLSDFITKARKVHGNKYDYSKVEYVNCMTKVCISCPEHGEFCQTPHNHTKGQGCPKCKGNKTRERFILTKEEFIKKAREKHNDKYDYSKVTYIGAHNKVCIICPEHGEFWQKPNGHLNGYGCSKCSGKYTPTKEEWIISAHDVHGDKYDYSKVHYVNNHTKVCIICPKPGHGEFWQTPNCHLSGQGCPKCGGVYIPTKEEWIASARKSHGNKYDCSKVEYVNCVVKVCIICPEHGEFWQTPNNHTNGAGCPKCNLSHLERSVMNYLDDMEITYENQKHFKWLGRQSLDFYLPDYNVGIECQGEQHFFPVDFAGKGVEWSCKNFEYVISCDKRKKSLCEKHGVKLLYFGNVPNYDIFLGEKVHDDVQYIIEYLNEYEKKKMIVK